jgi:CubicO group peptidase (beta-lactamase class C family)
MTTIHCITKKIQIKIAALLSAAFLFSLIAPAVFAQQGNLQLDAAMRAEVIEGALKQLNDAYVFPEVAKKMEAAIRERMQRKEYDAITSPSALAAALTNHLQEVSHDKHLRVTYSRESFRDRREPSKEEIEQQKAFAAARNFGFLKVERLDGNVGYIDFRGFMEADWAADTLAGAMNFLGNTDALIFDVRNNGGGQPEMVALICSYLFDKRTHLNDIYWRPTNKTTEYWTLDKFAGKRYGEQKAVYVLTSRRTFSAAEEFTYNLKNLKRATIVGETTGGGAHPVEFRRINEHFGIGVPAGRAINPITKTNWEGTGVKPDVEVAADQALKAAHLAAVKSVSAKLTNPELKQYMSGLIASLQREVDAPNSAPATQANSATPQATDDVKLPDTPAGKTLAAFLKAFNTGSLEALKKFHQATGGNPENAEQDLGFFNNNGGLKVASVVSSSTTEITVLAQKKKDGGWINFGIEVAPNPPHQIMDIRARPASAPAGAESAKPAAQASPSTDEPKLPDTPVGKTFAAFLKALNSGDLKTMQQFHQERGDDAKLASKDMEFYHESGGLKLHSISSTSNEELSALVQTKKAGDWLNLTMEVQSSPPHAIEMIRFQPASAPGNEKSASSAGNMPGNSAPAKRLTEAEKLGEFESFLNTQAAADKFSGVALVAKDGRPIFKKAYGLANKTTNAPNKLDTKFNLGSMNKMFTSVSIAQLAEAGKLSFDDKVGKFLPDYPNKDVRDKVSIHHLLTHTSGLGSYWNKKFDERRAQIKTVADYLALFADEPLRFEPGEKFEYSNSGFIVLGAIIEKVSGQNYFDYVRQHIYKPAGMTASDCFEMTESTPNMAMGYTNEGEHEGQKLSSRKENIDSRPNRGGPAGGGYSTPEDLLKFANALTANKLLSAKYTELITTGKVKMGGGGNQYAYGFGDLRINGKRAFGHNGGAPGIASSLSIFPETGYTVIVMTNYDPPMMMPVVRKIEGLVSQ